MNVDPDDTGQHRMQSGRFSFVRICGKEMGYCRSQKAPRAAGRINDRDEPLGRQQLADYGFT